MINQQNISEVTPIDLSSKEDIKLHMKVFMFYKLLEFED